jgi:hypothetical protein
MKFYLPKNIFKYIWQIKFKNLQGMFKLWFSLAIVSFNLI